MINPIQRLRGFKKKGFTIVELLLAMTFVAILLVAITVLVMNIQGIYRRGIAMREVNATSRSIIDDITRAISSAPSFSEGGSHAVTFRNGANTEGGTFCTGFYSYIWRHANFVPRLGSAQGAVQFDGSRDYRLIKIRDVGRRLCNQAALNGVSGMSCNSNPHMTCNVTGSPNITLAAFSLSDPVEMISSGGLELALFSFDIFEPARSSVTGQVFYAGSFVLGTPRGASAAAMGGLVSASVCTPPAQAVDFNFQYCSINKFNFAASSLGAIGER
ncbi:type II secretion system GspH family protein [Candidatus Saccharibacteria bacterium]|nr:type II secretion system GspH family protein [Candidatus Saccharibacteria bacterium]